MTKTRVKVLNHWLCKNRNNVNFFELLNFFFDKSYAFKAKAKTKEIILENDYYVVYLNDFSSPIYYPQNFS